MRFISGGAVAVIGIIMLFAQFGLLGGVQTILSSSPPAPKTIPLPAGWPPILDEIYPDLDLINQAGKPFKLSDFKGKIVIIVPISMTHPISQSLAGAMEYGSFKSNAFDAAQRSIETLLSKHIPLRMATHPDLVVIYVLFRNHALRQATKEETALWARHFKLDLNKNRIAATPAQPVPDHMSDHIIPGVHLIDHEGKFRADSSGLNPKHDLERLLIPMIPVMMDLEAARYENVIDP